VFRIIARKLSPFAVGASEIKGPISFSFWRTPHIDLQWFMLMFSNIMMIFTSPYMTNDSVDCSTSMKCCYIRKTQPVEVGLFLFNEAKKMTLRKWKENWELPH
jgi:hypothetical protein